MTVAPHFSPSRDAGQLVFVSGQMPFDAERRIADQGIEAQTARCIANLAALLERQGLGLQHVVKTTVWLTRVEDFAGFNREYARHFPTQPPARSTVRADLMVPNALIEIEAIAQRPG
jgi:2-iminobutanoate/2-iminopropanoate deaminase